MAAGSGEMSMMPDMELEKEGVNVVKEEQEEKGEEAIKDEEDEKKKKKLGGLRTMPFILANEACDRFATVGFHANMISYLTRQLNIPMVPASNTLTNFTGVAGFTPLVGALIADSFAGRFWTIAVGSVIYELGMVSIMVSALLPSLHPPPCPTQVNCKEASNLQLWILYASLLLTSIGTGGIRPCVVTFAADQLDMSKSKAASRKWNFFNLYFFCMGAATLLALTVVVYVQDNVGWGWGLGIPTVAVAISFVAFVVGSSLYVKLKPGGSPLARLAQVIVAAVRNRKVAVPADSGLLYENKELDADLCVYGKLLHTEQFKWFDKAAVVTEKAQADHPLNLWRLATVHRVEELKCIVRMLPIWAAGILLVAASSHQQSFTVIQARSMDRHVFGSFKIPPASLSIFGTLTILLGLVLYDRLLVPLASRFTKNPAGITTLQRMGIGFAVNILATLVASLVEIKRKKVASRHHLLDNPTATVPISVFWLVPQFCIHGAAEVFMSVGHIEFLYDQSPESMRSTAAALYWVAISIGNYVGSIVVSLVHKFTGKERNWLPGRNLNRGRLECYYWLVSGIQAMNLIYYIVCARCYTDKPLSEITADPRDERDEKEEEVLTEDRIKVSPFTLNKTGTSTNVGDVELAKAEQLE